MKTHHTPILCQVYEDLQSLFFSSLLFSSLTLTPQSNPDELRITGHGFGRAVDLGFL